MLDDLITKIKLE